MSRHHRTSGRHRAAPTARRALGSLLALGTLTGAAAAAAVAPSASAAPGNVVVLGDSLAANPNLVDYLSGKITPLPGGRLDGVGCGSDQRFANAVGAGSGLPAENYTCAGASFRTGGLHVTDQADRAAAQGALTGDTREVVIFAGANDTYPYATFTPNPMPVPQIRENLRVAIRDTVNHVRSLAPNAEIKITGYPRMTNDNRDVCLLNVIPGAPVQDKIFRTGEFEDAIQWAQIDGARDAGARFIDVKPLSWDHGMCSNDRWMAGLIDTTSGPRNLPLHMTDAGLDAVGRFVGEA